MKNLLFLGSAIILLFGSCKKDSDEVRQNDIYQKYTVRYNQDDNKTIYSAKFTDSKRNGRSLILTDGSNVRVNGHAMSRTGSNYYFTVYGPVVDTTIFTFVDGEGNIFNNIAVAAEYIANDNDNYINRSLTHNWTWYGNPVDHDERIDLTFKHIIEGNNLDYHQDSYGHVNCSLSPYSMDDMPPGDARVNISRTKTIENGDFNSVGGNIISIYEGSENIVEFY